MAYKKKCSNFTYAECARWLEGFLEWISFKLYGRAQWWLGWSDQLRNSKHIYVNKVEHCYSLECGIRPPLDKHAGGIERRIVQGDEADHHEWPWHVAIKRWGSYTCGGSIVDRLWIITAAHCARWVFSDETNAEHNRVCTKYLLWDFTRKLRCQLLLCLSTIFCRWHFGIDFLYPHCHNSEFATDQTITGIIFISKYKKNVWNCVKSHSVLESQPTCMT